MFVAHESDPTGLSLCQSSDSPIIQLINEPVLYKQEVADLTEVPTALPRRNIR